MRLGVRGVDAEGLEDIVHLMRQVVIYPGEDGYWVVECPSLPGCLSHGRTREEALDNIREAIDLYVETLVEQERPIPEDLLEVVAL